VDEAVAESLKRYLESNCVTIQSFKLSSVMFNRLCANWYSTICIISPRRFHSHAGIDEEADERDAQEHTTRLANLLRTKPGLESLRKSLSTTQGQGAVDSL